VNYQSILQTIQRDIVPFLGQGRVADYIPALARVAPTKFGIALYTTRGETYKIGDADEPFSIQSISKLFACTLAFRLLDDALWERVGREPSTAAFNSLAQLEEDGGRPRNPLINAGALVVTDIIASRFVQSELTVLNFLRRLSGNPGVDYSLSVARSELEHASRNLAMAHFMKSFGNLKNPADAVVDAYCRQCAIEMNCVDLARAVALFANHGVAPVSGERVLDISSTKRLCALMLTCGTYDGVGDFVYRVGLPAKSGVGGGIVAVLPGEMGICVWSPGLDRHGNSVAGVQALEWLTTLSGRSIF
jgi:glutaminase